MLMIKKRPLIFRPALNSHEHDREVLGGVGLDILGLARGGAKRLAPVSTASMACDYWHVTAARSLQCIPRPYEWILASAIMYKAVPLRHCLHADQLPRCHGVE